MSSQRIRNEFAVHRLNETGLEAADELAAAYSALMDTIDRLSPDPSREKSLAVTKLQESSFWAKRSIAMDVENQLGDAPPLAPVP